MSAPEGWNGVSVKEHVEGVLRVAGKANETADEALSLAQAVCDDLEALRAEFAVGPVSEAKAKVMRRSFEAIGQLALLGLGHEKVLGLKTPMDAAYHCGEIGMAINAYCNAALDFLNKKEVGNNE